MILVNVTCKKNYLFSLTVIMYVSSMKKEKAVSVATNTVLSVVLQLCAYATRKLANAVGAAFIIVMNQVEQFF